MSSVEEGSQHHARDRNQSCHSTRTTNIRKRGHMKGQGTFGVLLSLCGPQLGIRFLWVIICGIGVLILLIGALWVVVAGRL